MELKKQDKDFVQRRNDAMAAKAALLEKFKNRPSEDDPAVQARIAERKAIAEAREQRRKQREAERQAKRAEEARLKAEREAALEAERLARE
ncbi:MAG: DUF6481 family protein, partial [Nitratireductor sp.]